MPLLGTSPEAIDLAEDRGRFGACSSGSGSRRRRTRPRTGPRPRWPPRRASASRCSCGRATCSAGARWSSSTRRDALADYLRPHRRERRARDLPRPLPGERDRGRRRRDLRRRGRLDRRHHAARRGGRDPLRRLGLRAAAALARGARCCARSARRRRALALELGVVGLMNVQYGVLGEDALRDRGQPARVAHGAVRLQGDRAAAGEDRLPGDARRAARRPRPARRSGRRPHLGQGGGAAVRPLRRRRRAARAGDALDGRGDGRSPPTSRPRSPRRRRRRARSCRSSGTVFLTVTDTDKAAIGAVAAQLHDLGFSIAATSGTAGAIARMGIPVERLNKLGEGSPHVVDKIEGGDVVLVINTPTGTAARTDGYEIRRAAIARGDPVHHDDRGRHGRGARDRRRAPGGPGVRSLQEIHRGERRGAEAVRLVSATRGRALTARSRRSGGAALAVVGRREYGAYVVLSVADADGPAPDPGQFAMLAAAERWGGGADERPFLPRAFSVARRHDDGTLDFLLEDVGPGHRAARRAATPGDDALAARPAGPRLRRAARRAPADAGRRRRRDRAAGDLAGPARRRVRRRCSASATRPTPRAPRCSRDARIATDDGSVGHHGLVTELLARVERRRGDPARARGLRLRAAADARGGARALRRARRPGAARARGRDGLRLRRLLRLRRADAHAATSGSASTGRCSRRPSSSRGMRVALLELLRHRARRTRSSTRRAPSTRSPPGARSATRCCERFPFAAFVSKTVTLEPRQGNPPPRLWELGAGMINSIGLPNKGLARLPRRGPAAAGGAAGAADRQRDGLHARGGGALVAAFAERDEVAALELNVSCPNVRTGLLMGADPGETAALMDAVRPRTAKPLIVKLTPNCASPAAVAAAAEQHGADAVSLINTLRGHGDAPAAAARAVARRRHRRRVRARRSARSRWRRCARSASASGCRSSAWAACRPGVMRAICSTRARIWSQSGPNPSATRSPAPGSRPSLPRIDANSGIIGAAWTRALAHST